MQSTSRLPLVSGTLKQWSIEYDKRCNEKTPKEQKKANLDARRSFAHPQMNSDPYF